MKRVKRNRKKLPCRFRSQKHSYFSALPKLLYGLVRSIVKTKRSTMVSWLHNQWGSLFIANSVTFYFYLFTTFTHTFHIYVSTSFCYYNSLILPGTKMLNTREYSSNRWPEPILSFDSSNRYFERIPRAISFDSMNRFLKPIFPIESLNRLPNLNRFPKLIHQMDLPNRFPKPIPQIRSPEHVYETCSPNRLPNSIARSSDHSEN